LQHDEITDPSYTPIFSSLLDMLLQKTTALRATMDEILALPQVNFKVKSLVSARPDLYSDADFSGEPFTFVGSTPPLSSYLTHH
jgi:hypothetical protein